MLEDIHDPHNAEAVLRTCDVFGVQHVHLVFARQAPFNPRKLGKSTSSSANKWLDFTLHTSVQACLLGLRANGFLRGPRSDRAEMPWETMTLRRLGTQERWK